MCGKNRACTQAFSWWRIGGWDWNKDKWELGEKRGEGTGMIVGVVVFVNQHFTFKSLFSVSLLVLIVIQHFHSTHNNFHTICKFPL